MPKIFCGIRLEYFDRGAKPCSLNRPQDALRKLCSLHKGACPPGYLLIPLPSFLQQVAENPPSPLGRLIASAEGGGMNPSTIAYAMVPLPLGKGGFYPTYDFAFCTMHFALLIKKIPRVAEQSIVETRS